MDLDLVIFDWDGTLMDSTGRIVSCMQAAATSAGLPVLAAAEIEQIIGLGLPQAISTLYPGLAVDQVESMREQYAHHFVEAEKDPCELFAGVPEVLDELRQRGIGMAVATGKSRKGLERVWNSVPVAGFFQASRCADETESKPHPAMVLEILAETGASAQRSLVIGDTTHDLEMARRAGVAAMGVRYGAHREEQLLAHDPLLMMDSLLELLQWLDTGSRLPEVETTG